MGVLVHVGGGAAVAVVAVVEKKKKNICHSDTAMLPLPVYVWGGCGCGRKKNGVIWSGIERDMIILVLLGENVAVAIFFSFFSFFCVFPKTVISPSILPLPRTNSYHSNRLDLLYRLVPLPPNHCHSPPRHRHSLSALSFFSTFFIFLCLSKKKTVISPSILPLPLSNHHHSNRLDLLYPTAQLPPCHCHSPSHHRRFFEILWSMSLYIEAVAIVPQLLMLQVCGGGFRPI
jgi:hypothetical protein